MPHSSRAPDSPARRERRRRTHQRIDSNGDYASRSRRRTEEEEPLPPSPSKSRPKKSRHERGHSRSAESQYSKSASTALSSQQLAQLDRLNQKLGWSEYNTTQRPRVDDEETRAEYDNDREYDRQQRERAKEEERERRREEHRERKRQKRREERAAAEAALAAEEAEQDDEESYVAQKHSRYRRREGRAVSGQALERGSEYYSEKEEYRHDVRRRDGSSNSSDANYNEQAKRRKRRNWCIAAGLVLLALAIAIPVGVVVSKKKSSDSSSDAATATSSGAPSNSNLNGISESSIPSWAKGTYLDPFDWYDTTDFNVTFTNATVGGLYIMGLNSTWSDDTQANANVPKLNEAWDFTTMKVRGVNLGGWLSIEPFITPSLFSSYDSSDGVVDEYTLCQMLGSTAKSTIEQHYSVWVNESTFADIAAAGFDHVRIPFSYWAVTTYDGDPYVEMVSWRYLLRGIEWARKYGLRINLDLHGAPGSQNGWNHSGRQGVIGWLNGTDGTLNGERTIAIHKQLSTFFTQPRYKSIITFYGLVNEPRMTSLVTDTVMDWSQNAVEAIQANNYTGQIVIGDGFLGLENWQGKLTNLSNVVLDAHQYVVFNVDQIVLDHYDKVSYACSGWTEQTKESIDTSTGFGPTIFGEWSQADTDCQQYLNNVGVGSRWEGTLNLIGSESPPGGSNGTSVLTPTCPTDNDPRCDCTDAVAAASTYSTEYKLWLKTFAEAQMTSFEYGWGWFYWTWYTENAPQWSYKDGLAAGIMPTLAYSRTWNCNMTIPDFNTSSLPEYY